ncbi:hypothetical protein BDW69DRAFT_179461 [Aspergillus filifer]
MHSLKRYAPFTNLRSIRFAVRNEEMTRWLLDHGADPNAQAGLDVTPLSMAAESASFSTIKLLFEHGADVRKGQPLHHATKRKSEITEVLASLLEKGAPLNEEIYENHEYSRTAWGRIYSRYTIAPCCYVAKCGGHPVSSRTGSECQHQGAKRNHSFGIRFARI